MLNYTKGKTAGGWIYILNREYPIALVHPKHFNKLLASNDMYEALKGLYDMYQPEYDEFPPEPWDKAIKALAKAEGI